MDKNPQIITDNIQSSLEITDILSIVLAVISILFAIYTYYKSKNKEKLYSQIFEAASEKLDINKTSKELNEKKTKLNSIKDELEFIKETIPIEAQKAVLKDKIESVKKQLNKSYQEAIRLNSNLSKIENTQIEKIPESLLNKIKDFIEPKYLLREKIDNKKTLLTITTTIASISLLLFRNMIGYAIGSFSFIIAIPIIFSLSTDYFRLQKINNSISLLKTIIIAYILLIIMIIGLWLLSIHQIVKGYLNDFQEQMAFSMFFVGLILIPLGIYGLIKEIKKYNKQRTPATNKKYT